MSQYPPNEPSLESNDAQKPKTIANSSNGLLLSDGVEWKLFVPQEYWSFYATLNWKRFHIGRWTSIQMSLMQMEHQWVEAGCPYFRNSFQILDFLCFIAQKAALTPDSKGDSIGHTDPMNTKVGLLWAEACGRSIQRDVRSFETAFERYNPKFSKHWPAVCDPGFYRWIKSGAARYRATADRGEIPNVDKADKLSRLAVVLPLPPSRFLDVSSDQAIEDALALNKLSVVLAMEPAAAEMGLPVEALYHGCPPSLLREIKLYYDIWNEHGCPTLATQPELETLIAAGLLTRWTEKGTCWSLVPPQLVLSRSAIMQFAAALDLGPIVSAFADQLSSFDPSQRGPLFQIGNDAVAYYDTLSRMATYFTST